jgi:regulator of protease activity HflC (stomatin/prohibitin superfamily)
MDAKFLKNALQRANHVSPDLHISSLSGTIFVVCLIAAVLGAIALDANNADNLLIGLWAVGWTFIRLYFMFALKVAAQWEKAVVLRLGRFKSLRGPGVFWVVPIVDSIPSWIDHRVMVTPFSAEKALTKDTVPVNVDAVLFWVVWDAEKAALEVQDYNTAISWAAQTALREIIGQTDLSDILVGRAKTDVELQEIIDERTTPWGITVQSVEIRDVVIPQDLENAMSRRAQAERERQARVILGESEKQIAESFARAAKSYQDNPTAFHLRTMNMLFEGLKEKGALVVVPSNAVDTMNLGGIERYCCDGAKQPAQEGNITKFKLSSLELDLVAFSATLHDRQKTSLDRYCR